MEHNYTQALKNAVRPTVPKLQLRCRLRRVSESGVPPPMMSSQSLAGAEGGGEDAMSGPSVSRERSEALSQDVAITTTLDTIRRHFQDFQIIREKLSHHVETLSEPSDHLSSSIDGAALHSSSLPALRESLDHLPDALDRLQGMLDMCHQSLGSVSGPVRKMAMYLRDIRKATTGIEEDIPTPTAEEPSPLALPPPTYYDEILSRVMEDFTISPRPKERDSTKAKGASPATGVVDVEAYLGD
ncbi:unnamed protein product [Vitrella brassicaformis CCMP3155]|uniref:Uncharacterized protein n=1 Tax=Vitrella brassicaformis (strain CCMP3155) TaxID=1169540 RepID=A0A0G4G0C9_VITBC|nr:unnamed protein product [Vitrella brassicaformis CCMP3155]|eukprot:CEM21328.1 unnamed protein product [Vitrella brassicaformis CCMP3155]